MSGLRTLGEFIVEKQADFPHASGDLSSLLASIRLAAKIVNREINAAGLGDITGAVGTENVQGEDQQKLDVYANDKFKAALEAVNFGDAVLLTDDPAALGETSFHQCTSITDAIATVAGAGADARQLCLGTQRRIAGVALCAGQRLEQRSFHVFVG